MLGSILYTRPRSATFSEVIVSPSFFFSAQDTAPLAMCVVAIRDRRASFSAQHGDQRLLLGATKAAHGLRCGLVLLLLLSLRVWGARDPESVVGRGAIPAQSSPITSSTGSSAPRASHRSAPRPARAPAAGSRAFRAAEVAQRHRAVVMCRS